MLWASPVLPGAAHDLTAARTHGLLDAVTSNDIRTLADKGYQGAGGTVCTPFQRHRSRPPLSRGQKAVNRAHARIRARRAGRGHPHGLDDPDHAALLPRRATAVVAAILVLHHVETSRYPR